MRRSSRFQNPEGFPRAWMHFCDRIEDENLLSGDFGLQTNSSHAFLFAQRFRVANLFRGIDFADAMPGESAIAYSAMTKNFLAHTALEQYKLILGNSWEEMHDIFPAAELKSLSVEITGVDPEGKIEKYARRYLNDKRLLDELQNLYSSHGCGALAAARALRHLFAHGWMFSTPNELGPENMARICEKLAALQLTTMDSHFEGIVETQNC